MYKFIAIGNRSSKLNHNLLIQTLHLAPNGYELNEKLLNSFISMNDKRLEVSIWLFFYCFTNQ